MFLNKCSLIDHQKALRANKLSLGEFIDLFYERFSQVEPHIQAFLQQGNLRERLLRDAVVLAEKYSDAENRPPLYGVPVAVKDLIHVDGFPTRAGSQLPAEELTEREGSFIAKLRSLGALIPGKTATEEFAYSGSVPTRNPHNVEHTPGGSSSGSAAAVAAGLSPLAIGTQTLRSVIAPASFCGVAGFKPSYGRVPLDGVHLLSPSFDTIGFFTQDLPGMLYAAQMLIPDWRPFYADRKPVLGIPTGIYMSFMADDVKKVFENQVIGLEDAGYTVRRVDMPWAEEFIAGDDMLHLVQGEFARVHEGRFDKFESLYGPAVRSAIKSGREVSEEQLENYRRGQIVLRKKIEETKRIHNIDIWISPAQGGVAPVFGGRTGYAGMTSVWSYAGLPAVSIPSSEIGGLPLGFQCIGSYGNDEALLFWAQALEAEVGHTRKSFP